MKTEMILQNKNIKKDYYFLSKDKNLFVGYDDYNDCLVARWNTPTQEEATGNIENLKEFIKDVKDTFGYEISFERQDLVLFWNYWQKESGGKNFIEGVSPIKKSAEKMKTLGYYCIVDTTKPSIGIFDKNGNQKFFVQGNKAERYIEEFAEDPESLDPSLTIEDWMLGVYLFGRK